MFYVCVCVTDADFCIFFFISDAVVSDGALCVRILPSALRLLD